MPYWQWDAIPKKIAQDYAFLPHDETVYERWFYPDGIHIVRFANRTDHSNVLVKYDENEA